MGSGYFPDRHASSFFGQNVDFQPARDCPRNFIIFDRTGNRSQIMYNPGLNLDTTPVQKDIDAPTNEDLADIDALLSFEDEEEEYDDDDDVSTGRTGGHDGSDTSDSCSSRSRNGGPGLLSGHELKDSERKRDKMKKMVKSLKGIVPGVNGGMNTVAVLDEAVKYLKSLKVEAQKMGIGDLQG
ncbi:hypothetical protein L1887_37939 [Cichorium endivia]|nr:hypothetical protein L1887_37939 [Cichorium endivia]